MTTRSEEFAGLSVAMTTPFRNGDIDFDALQAQVEFQVQAGTTCLCPVGTTGESPTLSHPEHDQVITAVVKAAAGRIKVMPGTGSNSTAEAIRLTRCAAENGADAALVVAPYYNKPTQEGLFQHFSAHRRRRSTSRIVHLQHPRPMQCGDQSSPTTIVRLARGPPSNIVAVKHATGSMDQAPANPGLGRC